MKVSAGERRNGSERRKNDRRSGIHPGSKSTKTGSTDQKVLLTTREVGELLKVTQQTIKNYIYAGKLKSIKPRAAGTAFTGQILLNQVI
jgi:hypothetical protein